MEGDGGGLVDLTASKLVHGMPEVSLHTAGNALAWLKARMMLLNFGARYKDRIDFYVGMD